MTLSTLASSIASISGLKLKLGSRRAATSGRTWTVALKMSGLPSSACDDLDVRVRERQDPCSTMRLAVGVLDEVVDRLVEDGAGAEHALEDRRGRLAGTEAGDPGPPREAPVGFADGAVEALGAGPRPRGRSELLGAGVAVTCHRPASIGWAPVRARAAQ